MTRLLFALAVLPGLFFALKIYKMDKIEKESPSLIFKLGFFGIISTLPAILLELGLDSVLAFFVDSESLLYSIIENFIVVACVEEGCKMFFLKKGSWKSREFNYKFDGVVYAAAVGIGFAICENVFYAMDYGFSTTIVRALTAIPAHTIFAIFMGHYYGIAKEYFNMGDNRESKRYMKIAYVVPVFFHGLYDITAGSETAIGALLFLVIVILMDIFAYRRIKQYAANDEEI